MSQLLVLLAASVFVILGSLHGLLSLRDLREPKVFTPRDPGLREAMQRSSVALHHSINLWDAWMGFNLSHSLGLVLFGGAYLYVGLFHPQAYVHYGLLQACAVGVSAIYLLLSLRFWFSKPAIGSALALACFALAAILDRV